MSQDGQSSDERKVILCVGSPTPTEYEVSFSLFEARSKRFREMIAKAPPKSTTTRFREMFAKMQPKARSPQSLETTAKAQLDSEEQYMLREGLEDLSPNAVNIALKWMVTARLLRYPEDGVPDIITLDDIPTNTTAVEIAAFGLRWSITSLEDNCILAMQYNLILGKAQPPSLRGLQVLWKDTHPDARVRRYLIEVYANVANLGELKDELKKKGIVHDSPGFRLIKGDEGDKTAPKGDDGFPEKSQLDYEFVYEFSKELCERLSKFSKRPLMEERPRKLLQNKVQLEYLYTKGTGKDKVYLGDHLNSLAISAAKDEVRLATQDLKDLWAGRKN